jgi:integrase
VLRVTVGSKRREIGLGAFPEVTLAKAHEKARAVREQITQGVDPVQQREAAARRLKATQASAKTFDQCVSSYIAAHAPTWSNTKHRQQWENTLGTYASPTLGALAVQDIDTAHIVKVLEVIWATKTETATRLRGRVEQVLDWATVQGLRGGPNPARWRGHLDKLLAKPSKVAKVEHHAALGWDRMGEFMQRLRGAAGMGARALEFAILTGARSGEVRGAQWSEFDLEAGLWTVPADRMKAKRVHRVPLTPQAVQVLRELPRLDGATAVFWGMRGGELSDMSLSAVLRRLGVSNDTATVHGFRSTFRDWAAERTAYPRELAEAALAHTNADKVEAAYLRTDLIDKRRGLMQAWADFCDTPSASVSGGGVVVPIGAAARAA